MTKRNRKISISSLENLPMAILKIKTAFRIFSLEFSTFDLFVRQHFAFNLNIFKIELKLGCDRRCVNKNTMKFCGKIGMNEAENCQIMEW